MSKILHQIKLNFSTRGLILFIFKQDPIISFIQYHNIKLKLK